jgi:sugar phosphate isomerase/epimerase
MSSLKALEPGVMFWTGRDHVAEVKQLGVRCGQLGIDPSFEFTDAAADDWRSALEQEQFTLVTFFAAYAGESYADIPTVQRTVGFIPRATRIERFERTCALSDFAAQLGVPSIACHIGFVPEDRTHVDYVEVRELVRRICDYAARHNQTFALETGQEPAAELLHFLHDVDRVNIAINFDPANMILYGTGDPVEALGILGKHVISVHCKDGLWPPKGDPNALGTEVPLGAGDVGIERFLAKLKEIGFRGPLNVEREAENQPERLHDIREAVALLKRLTD